MDDIEKAFQVLEIYGVPRTRARTVANGIEVLVDRLRNKPCILPILSTPQGVPLINSDGTYARGGAAPSPLPVSVGEQIKKGGTIIESDLQYVIRRLGNFASNADRIDNSVKLDVSTLVEFKRLLERAAKAEASPTQANTARDEIFCLLKVAKSDCKQHNWEKLLLVLDRIGEKLSPVA
jgi:hypothetical protein